MTTTAPLIAVLDRLWSAVRTQHPDVPPAVISMSAVVDRGHLVTLSAARWSGGPDAADVPELAVTSAALEAGPECLLAAVLHAAAHGLGEVRRVTTTSRQGRYHNTRFADLAREVGLTVEQTAAGWSETALAPGANVTYAVQLRELREQLARLPVRREASRATAVGRASNNNPVSMWCGCQPARRIGVAPSVVDQGPILCGLCQRPFRLERPS